MKLKTLKDCIITTHTDVGEKDGPYEWIPPLLLKQEAIKWVKEDIEAYRTAKLNLPKGEVGINIHNFIVQRRQFWKYIFNITDEDLK